MIIALSPRASAYQSKNVSPYLEFSTSRFYVLCSFFFFFLLFAHFNLAFFSAFLLVNENPVALRVPPRIAIAVTLRGRHAGMVFKRLQAPLESATRRCENSAREGETPRGRKCPFLTAVFLPFSLSYGKFTVSLPPPLPYPAHLGPLSLLISPALPSILHPYIPRQCKE